MTDAPRSGLTVFAHLLKSEARATHESWAVPVETEGGGGNVDLVAVAGKTVLRANQVRVVEAEAGEKSHVVVDVVVEARDRRVLAKISGAQGGAVGSGESDLSRQKAVLLGAFGTYE